MKPSELIENGKEEVKTDELNAHKDPEEFFTQLKSMFSAEFIYFEYIIHHLFGFYSDEIRIIDNCKHSSTSRAIGHALYFNLLTQGLTFLNHWKI